MSRPRTLDVGRRLRAVTTRRIRYRGVPTGIVAALSDDPLPPLANELHQLDVPLVRPPDVGVGANHIRDKENQMKPAPFEYSRPSSLEEAIGLLESYGDDAKVLAGGQSIIPMMNLRFAQPRRLIDMNWLPGLHYIRLESQQLAIGALARHNEIRESEVVRSVCPLISEAYSLVANPTVRNRGTLCGNLCHADPASEMPAVMLALDATMVVQGRTGRRTVPAGEFFKGIYTTAIMPGELLVEVRVPCMPESTGYGIEEMSVRKGDFALAAVVAVLGLERGIVRRASIAVSGISSRALRLSHLDGLLVDKRPSESLFKMVAEEVSKIDITASAEDEAAYRRDLLRALTVRALSSAAGRAA